MKDRIVYFGGFDSDKSEELKKFAIDRLKNNKGEGLHYILPNRELLRRYRYEFVDELDFLFDLKVDTFDDMVDDILKYDLNKTIERPMKNFILKNIVIDLLKEGKLNYYVKLAELDGFIDFVGDKIGEIKRSLIYPNEYINKTLGKIEFYEIGLIYQNYEKYLSENNLLDREGKYFKAIDLLNRDEYGKVDRDIVIIDYFYDFRPVELEIIKELIKTNSNIYINMPFYTYKENLIVKKTINDLETLGFTIENLKGRKESDSATEDVFVDIGQKMFSDEFVIIGKDKLEITRAPDISSEVNNIFLEIKKLYVSEVSLNDIAIMVTDDIYYQAIFEQSKVNQIGINKARSLYLYEQPIVIEIMNIFKNSLSNLYKYDVINRLNSYYFRIMDEDYLSKSDLNTIEMIIRNLEIYRLEGNNIDDKIEHFKSEFNKISLNNFEDDRESYSSIIEEIIRKLDLEREKLVSFNTIEKYNDNIKNLIKDYKVYDKVMKSYQIIGSQDLFLRDIRTLNNLDKIFDDMEEIYEKDKKISLDEYVFIFEQYILDTEILIEAGDKNGVKILNPVTSRGQNIDYLFVLGLTQGLYPKISKGDMLNNKENFEFIKSIGLNVLNYHEMLDKENMNLISGLSKTKKKLYLSFNSGKDDSKIESMYLSEIIRLVENREMINRKTLRLGDRFNLKANEVKNKDELLFYTIQNVKEKKYIDRSLKVFNEELVEGRIDDLININMGEYYRANDVLNNYQGFLEDDINLLEVREFNDRNYSISYLEDYARCPYSFMMKRIFKVDELIREYEEYDHMLIGNIYHDILMGFYLAFKDVIKSNIEEGIDFDRTKVDEEIKRQADDVFNKLGINLLEKTNYIIYEGIKRNLIAYINYDLDNIFKYKFIPDEFEKEFSNLTIKDDNKEINIVGKIDRIDKSLYSNYYTVFDYKTSSYGLRKLKDIEDKLSFQLPVYIMSQMDKEVIQGGYGIIKDQSNEYIMVKEELSPFKRRNNSLTEEAWDEVLNKVSLDILDISYEIDNANFSVDPKECSEYCIYKDICRYKKIRR